MSKLSGSRGGEPEPKKPAKPAKPYPDFPLFAHATGRWAKKVRGKFRYFGPWDDPFGALDAWLRDRDDLLAGRTPRHQREGVTVKELCNAFMAEQESLRDAGEIAERTYADYFRACSRLIQSLGKNTSVEGLTPEDFSRLRRGWLKKWGPVTVGNEIARVKVLFAFADDQELIPHPLRFGKKFRKPTRKTLRLHRQKQAEETGLRMFTADELRRIIQAAPDPIKAMVLLGINCGFGQSDCAALPRSHLKLREWLLEFPRPKTGIGRRCFLWPETVAAIKAALKARPEAKAPEDEKLAFLTRFGGRWVKTTAPQPGKPACPYDALGHRFSKLLSELEIKREGLGFYALRHTFRTVADEARDTPAVDLIMGHADESMGARYREKIDDSRLKTVADHVRKWLFG